MKRRDFLRVAAAALGGLLLEVRLPAPAKAAAGRAASAVFAWLRVAPSGEVTVLVPKMENGQGITTALAMLVAEELEVRWESVRFEMVAPSPETVRFLTPETSGSRSVREAWEPLRLAGAEARERLEAAAAKAWGAPKAACRAREGFVHHADGRKLSFGELAPAAAKLPRPARVELKKPGEHRLIGHATPRLDAREKSTGRAVFGIDATLPGMLHASVRLSPVPGGKIANLAELRRKAPPGVKMLAVPLGVAAVAGTFWKAEAALRAHEPLFRGGDLPSLDSGAITRALDAALAGGGRVCHESGTPPAVGEGARAIRARYEVPYLAHATMEPLTCLAHASRHRCDLYLGTKVPEMHRQLVAKELGLRAAQVHLHPLFQGGSFGRRGEPEYVLQAVKLSRALGRPVKVVWTREQDIQHDTYRPAFVASLEAEVRGNEVLSLRGVNAGQGISHLKARAKAGEAIDRNSIDYWNAQHYQVPHRRFAWASLSLPVPVGFWRSTGASQNAFFLESFLDELAHATSQDPLELRLRLCAGSLRARSVLEKAAAAAGWGKKQPEGQALGISLSEVAETFVAQVARVSVENGQARVHEITCAYDCGPVVNPDGAAAQIEGGVVFGLSAALFGEITISGGRTQQGNFHDYRVVRMSECPRINVLRVESDAKPGGIGEVGVAGVAPAICNGLFRLTGRRIRKLPIQGQLG